MVSKAHLSFASVSQNSFYHSLLVKPTSLSLTIEEGIPCSITFSIIKEAMVDYLQNLSVKV